MGVKDSIKIVINLFLLLLSVFLSLFGKILSLFIHPSLDRSVHSSASSFCIPAKILSLPDSFSCGSVFQFIFMYLFSLFGIILSVYSSTVSFCVSAKNLALFVCLWIFVILLFVRLSLFLQ